MSTEHDFRFEPDWLRAYDRSSYTAARALSVPVGDSGDKPQPIMQTDSLKNFYLTIVRDGLQVAYETYKRDLPFPTRQSGSEHYSLQVRKTKYPKKVVIIGAGMAGLVAAYELSRAGHKVEILEMQHRVGGRVKTLADEHFFPGLWGDAGAMRIPGSGNLEDVEKKHYLTNYYAQVIFGLKTIPFLNQTQKGYYYLYGKKYSMEDWKKNADTYCNDLWPGWDSNLPSDIKTKYNIKEIADYYSETMKPVMNEIRNASGGTPSYEDWVTWTQRWTRFSVMEFLTSSYEVIMDKLKEVSTDIRMKQWHESQASTLQPLKDLLPWGQQAILGYMAYNYSESFSQCLVEILRDDLGQWWYEPMHTYEEGASSLPWAFTKKKGDVNLSHHIKFGMSVTRVKYSASTSDAQPKVEITARNDSISSSLTFNGDATIITVPLNIIRQMKFNPALSPKCADALSHISYAPATKILLQCKTRFWEDDHNIHGGFSFTNLPIGQVHYPSNPHADDNKRGILMCYTWKQEGLLFGSQPKQMAIAKAIEEVGMIHEKAIESFEVGAVQAWYSDPSSQGAYALLEPFQLQLIYQTLLYPYPMPNDKDAPPAPIYFAGEAISFTDGWIQGALESGLRAAYQFYARNENYNEH